MNQITGLYSGWPRLGLACNGGTDHWTNRSATMKRKKATNQACLAETMLITEWEYVRG